MTQPALIRKCAFVKCPRLAVRGGFCKPCHAYAYETLANPRFRTEKPPAAPR